MARCRTRERIDHMPEDVLPSHTSIGHHIFRTWVISNIYYCATQCKVPLNPKFYDPSTFSHGWTFNEQHRPMLQHIFEDDDIINDAVNLREQFQQSQCSCKTGCKARYKSCYSKHVPCRVGICKCGSSCTNPHNTEIGPGYCTDPECPRRPPPANIDADNDPDVESYIGNEDEEKEEADMEHYIAMCA
jgi:hypothetical protein